MAQIVVNISMTPQLFIMVEKERKRLGLTRSGFITHCILKNLELNKGKNSAEIA